MLPDPDIPRAQGIAIPRPATMTQHHSLVLSFKTPPRRRASISVFFNFRSLLDLRTGAPDTPQGKIGQQRTKPESRRIKVFPGRGFDFMKFREFGARREFSVFRSGNVVPWSVTEPPEGLAAGAVVLRRHAHHAVLLHVADEAARGRGQQIVEPPGLGVDLLRRAADRNGLVADRHHEALPAAQPAAHRRHVHTFGCEMLMHVHADLVEIFHDQLEIRRSSDTRCAGPVRGPGRTAGRSAA